MNSVQLVGRFTRDPEIKYTDGGLSVAKYTLAIDRRFKKEGEQAADFISCVAFGKTAEFIERYFRQGMRIGAMGRIQTGNYTNKEGIKIYTTDVVVEQVEFVENKPAGTGNSGQNPKTDGDGFMNIPEDIDEELPFN